MDKRLALFLAALVILPIAFFGCKSKVETPPQTLGTEATGSAPSQEEMMATLPIEPAQTVAMETIPPTAAPQGIEKPIAISQEMQNRNMDIQKALKSAGFYTGAVDGKIGPKTKNAIEEFQKSKGLKPDGKVGPRTWAELETYLTQ